MEIRVEGLTHDTPHSNALAVCAIPDPLITSNAVWDNANLFSEEAQTLWRQPSFAVTRTWINHWLGNSHMRSLSAKYFRRDFVAAWLQETSGWDWADGESRLDPALRESIKSTPEACPQCKGTGKYPRLMRGRKAGMLVRLYEGRCRCGLWALFEREWEAAMGHRKRFADVRLGTLAPNDRESWLPLDRQAEVIALLQAHPSDSYLLMGSANTGKSHYLTALFRSALAASVKDRWERNIHERSVWRYTTAGLLDQHEAWARRDREAENHGLKPPTLMASHIHLAAKMGMRPCLFLDEIDKIAPTDHKTRTLFELLDAVYEAEGQVVATTNSSIDTLNAKWKDDRADAVLRRIGNGDGAHTVLFRVP